MTHELKNCSICGATELKRIGVEKKDGQVFGVYKCPSCDAELSAYDKFLKTRKDTTPIVSQPEATEEAFSPHPKTSTDRTAIVNIAADVYHRAINSTLALVAKMDDGSMCGTGTMVSEKGYFITNAHVVSELAENRKTVLNFSDEVYGESGEHSYRFAADLVYVNPLIDLALLKTDPNKELVPVTFSMHEVFPGEAVYAIGNSKGEGLCIVEGIISDVHRKIGNIDAIMISAPVTHGNSGGPVFDSDGKLIGIVQSGRNDVSSMNYVIPVETILDFLQEARDREDCDL